MKRISKYVVMLFVIVILASCGNYKGGNESDKNQVEASGGETSGGGEEESADADPAPDLSKTDNIVRITGKLALDPQNRADISPIAGGVVRRITTREGYRVARGQVVAYIENTEIVVLQRQYLTTLS